MIQVRCLLCLEKEQDRIEKLAAQESWNNEKLAEKLAKSEEMAGYSICASIIGKTPEEQLTLLGEALKAHVASIHQEEARKLVELMIQSAGFQLMKYFETKEEDSLFEKEKEKMREKILNETLKFTPEESFEEDDEDEDEDEDIDDDCLEDDEDEDEDEELTEEEPEEEEEEEEE